MQYQERIKRNIINTASEVFTRFGFRKTTMDDIASAVKRSKSSIYYYFENKEAIFKAVIEKEANEFREEVHKKISSVEDPIEQLKSYVLIKMKKLDKLTNFSSALTSNHFNGIDFIEKFRKEHDTKEKEIVNNIIMNGIENGVLKIEYPDISTLAIITTIKGFEASHSFSNRKNNLEKKLHVLFNSIFYGIVKR